MGWFGEMKTSCQPNATLCLTSMLLALIIIRILNQCVCLGCSLNAYIMCLLECSAE